MASWHETPANSFNPMISIFAIPPYMMSSLKSQVCSKCDGYIAAGTRFLRLGGAQYICLRCLGREERLEKAS